jgi:hypothetical protein
MIHCNACDQDKDNSCFHSVETKIGNNIINSYLFEEACKDCISEDEIVAVNSGKRPDLRIAAGYNTKIRKEISNKGWTFEWNAVQKLFYENYGDVKTLSNAYKENTDQFKREIRFFVDMGFLNPKTFTVSNSSYKKLSKTFKKESFYKIEELNTLAALIKGKKFKKRDDRIYSKLEEYNLDQDSNSKNLFKSSLGVEYILQPRDKTLDRTCSVCLHVKSLEAFTFSGHDAYQCHDCHRTMSQQRYENRPEEYKIQFRKNVKAYSKEHPEYNRSKNRFKFSGSLKLPLGKTSTWFHNEYILQFFYDHPSGIKMINAGETGARVEGGKGGGYKTEMVFNEKMNNLCETPIYDELGQSIFETHWQMDHSIPSSVINKACEEFSFDVKQVYANHYLNLRPMWQQENLDKLDTIATYLLEDASQLNNLIKEIFIDVTNDSELFKIINYFKKVSLHENAQSSLFVS